MPVARNPRKVTVNAVTPTNLRDASKPDPATVDFFYTGGTVKISSNPNMTYASGFSLPSDAIQNYSGQGPLYAMCAAGTLEIEIMEYDR